MTQDVRPFTGKVALVSGAGAGLGRAYAIEFARLGAAIVVNDIGGSVRGEGNSDAAQSVVEEIVSDGGRAIANTDSVAEIGAGARIVEQALDAFGRIDIVVNNAGILRDKEFANLDLQSWNAVLDVHLRGAYEVTKAAWAHMCNQDFGRIVLTTSAAGLFGNAGHANYGAAKAGIYGLTRMLAVEAFDRNINVNAVAPLAFTRMSESKDGDRSRASDMMGSFFAQLAPEHVAPVVAWLCHEACQANGQVFSVGGGRVAEIFMGETRGWVGANPSWKDVRDNWAAVCAHDADSIPKSMRDEIALYQAALTHPSSGVGG
ncbi:SDR family NAD(P)-dependent oxidoreductase [Rhodococcus sp. WS4]|nr:SDR family NAD(P)-dependent oxidoreductase [Rhodococcus sp. WS4]